MPFDNPLTLKQREEIALQNAHEEALNSLIFELRTCDASDIERIRTIVCAQLVSKFSQDRLPDYDALDAESRFIEWCKRVDQEVIKERLGRTYQTYEEPAYIKEVYLAPRINVKDFIKHDEYKSEHEVVLDKNPKTNTPHYWSKLKFNKGSVQVGSTLCKDEGRSYYKQFIRLEDAKLLSASVDLITEFTHQRAVAIARDSKGKTYLLGRIGGLELIEASFRAADDLVTFKTTATLSAYSFDMYDFIPSGTVIQVWDGTSVVDVTL
jgi:hypothetical protein